jgi:hypothetical protein
MTPQSLATRLLIPLLFFISASAAFAQPDKPKVSDDEKAQQVIQRALKTVGGDRYLQVKTIIGRVVHKFHRRCSPDTDEIC